ncbi:MAG: NosD domain-containing protein [Candidatus Kariarchaeaceae archaeon]
MLLQSILLDRNGLEAGKIYFVKAYTYSGSIYIDSDDDFEQHGFKGNGSAINPYNLFELKIESVDLCCGISITNTTKYFIIQGCIIDTRWRGIALINVSSNTAVVSNNIIKGPEFGIVLDCAPQSTVLNNVISSTITSTWIKNSPHSNVSSNIMTGGGIKLEDRNLEQYKSYNFHKNVLNEKEIKIYSGLEKFTFNQKNFSQIILLNCSDGLIINQSIKDLEAAITLLYSRDIRIENCNISGVYLNACSNIIVKDNICNNALESNSGIEIGYSSNCIVSDNIFSNSIRGFNVYHSTNLKISDNRFYQNKRSNIISSSPETMVVNNTCDETTYGDNIVLRNSPRSQLISNVIKTTSGAVKIESSPETTIAANNFSGGGIGIYGIIKTDYLGFIISQNLINGKELGFFYNEDNFEITEQKFGQIILLNCSNGLIRNQNQIKNIDVCLRLIKSNNIVVEQNDFSFGHWVGIFVLDSHSIEIKNNICNDALRGVQVFDAEELLIIENQFNSNSYYAIEGYSLNNSQITKNICINSEHSGIKLYGSENTTILNNNILNARYTGINLIRCSNCNILDTSCFNCGTDGMRIEYCQELYIGGNNFSSSNFDTAFGIQIYASSDCKIYGNTIDGCGKGMIISVCQNLLITYNSIKSNNHGIQMSVGTKNCSIHHNSFIHNPVSDNGANNTWYDPLSEEGNYWSNWNISSGAYIINGTAGALDLYPLDYIPTTSNLQSKKFSFDFSLIHLLGIISLVFLRSYIRKKS